MTAKEYLLQAADIDLKIDSIRISIQRCREQATSTSSLFSDIPPQHNGSVSDKIGSNAEKIADYEAQAKEMMIESERLKSEIAGKINLVKNNLYSSLLFDKYISNMTWQEVSEHINKEYDYTKGVLHDRALNEFAKVMYKN